MVTYEKFEEWLNATLDNVTTRAETKHCVGVTESKLEEHKVIMCNSCIVNVAFMCMHLCVHACVRVCVCVCMCPCLHSLSV